MGGKQQGPGLLRGLAARLTLSAERSSGVACAPCSKAMYARAFIREHSVTCSCPATPSPSRLSSFSRGGKLGSGGVVGPGAGGEGWLGTKGPRGRRENVAIL